MHKHTTKKSTIADSQSPAAAVPPALPRTVTHEQIARLAYSFWEARGCQGGSEHDDWLRAERELLFAN
jgi:hypothetical protein